MDCGVQIHPNPHRSLTNWYNGEVTITTLDSVPNSVQSETFPGQKRVLLLKPRGFCAGVVRAIDIVKIALETFGAPIYVRREIVHNRYVVNELAEKGAIFVHEIDDVPDGQRVIYSAHGVSPAVRETQQGPRPQGDRRDLPAGHEGPHRGGEVCQAGIFAGPDRPPRPR